MVAGHTHLGVRAAMNCRLPGWRELYGRELKPGLPLSYESGTINFSRSVAREGLKLAQ